jgi:hypothetical protein
MEDEGHRYNIYMVIAFHYQNVLEPCFHCGPPFWGIFPVDHHYLLNRTVVVLLDAFSYASTLEWFMLVAHPRCKDEKCVVDAL